MIYQIGDKYYINVAPNIFKEVNLRLKNNDLILVPTSNKIEVYKLHEVKRIFFNEEKENLKKKLFPQNEEESGDTGYVGRRSRSTRRR